MSQGEYAVVDVDDEINDQGNGLEFKTFLPTENNSRRATSPTPPEVPYSPFNIAYYQTYFDVDTNTVLKRVGMAMIPRPGFITENCDGQIDLYGPFWTLTTLILILYITSTLISSITQYLSTSHAESNLPLLSTSISLIYFYGLGVPTLLWGITRWLSVGEWSLIESLGLYGYSMSIYIPISLLCLIPVGILRWVLIFAAAGSSGYFLVQNIYPVLASADNKMVRLLIIGVAVLHGGAALAIKVLFFSNSSIGPDPIPISDPML
ncbi:uncharacterized protein L201_007385 [Kwoniella dendrophila CBS 6074]|uniref:Protein YIP n=1 Tax=Kwoniella dendrophila CBS 6074 TaxID=1295534 RepID=A0AAX4K6N6_9TREE